MGEYVDALTGKWDDRFHPSVVAQQQKRAQDLIAMFDTDATVDAGGVVRWNSNNQVPPKDVLELWQYVGKPFGYEASLQVQEAETAAFLAEYRRHYKGPSAEQIAEARAAHGPGVELVDVITGRKFRT